MPFWTWSERAFRPLRPAHWPRDCARGSYDIREVDLIDRETMVATLRRVGRKGPIPCDTDGCAIKIGGTLEADRIIVGRMVKSGEICTVTLKMLDVQTETVVKEAIARREGPLAQQLDEILDDLVEVLLPAPKKSHKWVWAVVGTVVAGGAGTAVVLSRGKEEVKPPPEPSELPEPPDRPKV